MSFEWSCNCPDFAQNMHDLHQEAKHTSLFCLVFLRPSLGLWRYVASDFKTFNRGRVFESSLKGHALPIQSSQELLPPNPKSSHSTVLEASALKDVESAGSKVQSDCWLAPGRSTAVKSTTAPLCSSASQM